MARVRLHQNGGAGCVAARPDVYLHHPPCIIHVWDMLNATNS